MKNKITINILILYLVSFSACEYPWSINETVYVSNKTSDSIQVAIFEDVFISSNYSKHLVLPNSEHVKLQDINGFFLGGKRIDKKEMMGLSLGILIYHIKDSTSVFINNGYPEDVKCFYKYTTTNNDVDNKKRNIIAHTEIVITEDMLREMTKDTALTDSIFSLN